MLFPLSALCTQPCFHHSLLPSPFPFVSPWLWTQRSPLPWGPVYLSHFPLFDIQLLRDRRRKGKNKFSNSLLRGRSLSKTLTGIEIKCQFSAKSFNHQKIKNKKSKIMAQHGHIFLFQAFCPNVQHSYNGNPSSLTLDRSKKSNSLVKKKSRAHVRNDEFNIFPFRQ